MLQVIEIHLHHQRYSTWAQKTKKDRCIAKYGLMNPGRLINHKKGHFLFHY